MIARKDLPKAVQRFIHLSEREYPNCVLEVKEIGNNKEITSTSMHQFCLRAKYRKVKNGFVFQFNPVVWTLQKAAKDVYRQITEISA